MRGRKIYEREELLEGQGLRGELSEAMHICWQILIESFRGLKKKHYFSLKVERATRLKQFLVGKMKLQDPFHTRCRERRAWFVGEPGGGCIGIRRLFLTPGAAAFG